VTGQSEPVPSLLKQRGFVFLNLQESSMKPERAMLLDVSSSMAGSIALREILGADFKIAGPTRIDPTAADEDTFERELELIIRQFEPRLIFVVSIGDKLKLACSLLPSLRHLAAEIPVIAAIEGGAPTQTLELLEAGAADFVTIPMQPTDVLARAWHLLKQSPHHKRVTGIESAQNYSKKLIGNSPNFLQQVAKIPLIAGSAANVLLIGETGTGKELYARAIHYGSARAGKPFIPVNCGAIPVELVENELFGHQRGAYTSASSHQVGLIEEAHGGTLFLDEIDCLPIFAQVKLLRFLQEKEYRPLGSSRMRRANVRIIAASNLDLEEAVGNGKVRQDLFYRLNIISLTLPPLRERREDIPLLAQHFLTKYGQEEQKEVVGFSAEALHKLMLHNWPGNVRELEHAIERSIVLCHQGLMQSEDLLISNGRDDTQRESMQEAKAKEIARFEKNYIQGLLSICRGNITRAAQVARKNRRAFWQLIQKHQIDVNRFKRTA
jgi:DNA-binding NtrC family response regulator